MLELPEGRMKKMIPNPSWPLRYRISKWEQLKGAMSNTSRALHIVVTKFLNDRRLVGTRIKVEHDTFGTLFATIVDVNGTLTTDTPEQDTFVMTPGQILAELRKWGFEIEYNPMRELSGNQINFLMTIRDLHYDKIRIMSVYDYVNGLQEFKWYVVAFQIDALGDWVNAGYSVSRDEFNNAINSGYAMNISALSEAKNYQWDWLYNWVGDINDILEANS